MKESDKSLSQVNRLIRKLDKKAMWLQSNSVGLKKKRQKRAYLHFTGAHSNYQSEILKLIIIKPAQNEIVFSVSTCI